jgi:hypothetical protein
MIILLTALIFTLTVFSGMLALLGFLTIAMGGNWISWVMAFGGSFIFFVLLQLV